jgi:hypothetical protein
MPKESFRDSDNKNSGYLYSRIPEIYKISRLGREGLNSLIL